MPDTTLFKVPQEDEITSEELSLDDLAREVRNAPKGAWGRDEDWPILFAQVKGPEGDPATLVVPFDEPREFQQFLQDENLEKELVSASFDMDILERIEKEIA